jgi:hypothetical protein
MAGAVRRGFLVALLVSLIGAPVFLGAEARAVYEQIRVFTGPDTDRAQVFFHPDLELMGADEEALTLLSRPELTAELRARGFDVEVMIPDLETYYASRNAGTRDYGVWHTYAEMWEEMYTIHAEYPQLTTQPMSIGTTGEGRTLWAMKVSDNPNVQEDEPEVLFDGVHHAREIMALEIPLHFIRYLCENYGTDPVITFIVDNRQVWFVPMVNVDGFVYNEQTHPNGGGMWRKNRRDNGIPGCEGVDPNRNYPFQWTGQGSSTDPCDETYRGPSARSEPEIQAHTNFINAHNFATWETYHSVLGAILFPWGYSTQPTPDHERFKRLCADMIRDSRYGYGQCSTYLYMVNGGAIDWGYGATTEHPRIYAVTTEVGGSGFWPQPSEREGLIAENLYSNIHLCLVAGGYLHLETLAVTGGDGNGRLDPGETAALAPNVINLGMRDAVADARVTVACDDPYITLHAAQTLLGTVDPGETVTAGTPPLGISIDPGCPEGREVDFRVRLEGDACMVIEEVVQLVIGQRPMLYGCDFESAEHGWTQDPSHNAQLGYFERIDPIPTPFQPGDDTTPDPGIYGWITLQNPGGQVGYDVDRGIAATRSPTIDLSGVARVRLDMNDFFGQNEEGDDPEDFFRIDVSNDGGATYPANLVLIGDVSHGPDWMNLQADLEEYLPLTSQMVIRIQASDGLASADIIEGGTDDVFLYVGGSGNEAPSQPVLVYPPEGGTGVPLTPELLIGNAIDPEGDPLTYGFRVYADPELTVIVAAADGVPEGAGGTTAWTLPSQLQPETTYYWRAYAADPELRGLYAPAVSFTTIDAGSSVGGAAPAGGLALAAGPNPARGAVRIRYYTPATANSRLEIVDVAGRRVRTLPGVRWTAGWHEVAWDGRDEAGQPVGSGAYWVRLVLPTETRTVRVMQLP